MRNSHSEIGDFSFRFCGFPIDETHKRLLQLTQLLTQVLVITQCNELHEHSVHKTFAGPYPGAGAIRFLLVGLKEKLNGFPVELFAQAFKKILLIV